MLCVVMASVLCTRADTLPGLQGNNASSLLFSVVHATHIRCTYRSLRRL